MHIFLANSAVAVQNGKKVFAVSKCVDEPSPPELLLWRISPKDKGTQHHLYVTKNFGYVPRKHWTYEERDAIENPY